MKIFVIRHGLTELNKARRLNGQIDEPLSPEGIKQARSAINLVPKTIKFIYTSPLQRAQHTAEIINSHLNTLISPQEELTEIHVGSLAGKGWEEIAGGLELKKKHRSHQFNYHLQDGESAADVKKRVLAFLKQIKGKHGDGEVLLVTHGGIIRLLHLLEHHQQIPGDIQNLALYTLDIDKILK